MLLLGVLQAQAAGGAAGVPAFDLLETQVLDSAESSVTFSSLSSYAADYQHLQIRGTARSDRSTFSVETINMAVNGQPMTKYHRLFGTGSSVLSTADASIAEISTNVAATGSFGAFVIDILDFAETSKNKTIRAFSGTVSDDAGGYTGKTIQLASSFYNSDVAITSVTLDPTFGSLLQIGSRFSLYGIKAA